MYKMTSENIVFFLICFGSIMGCSSSGLLQNTLNQIKSPYVCDLFSQEATEITVPTPLPITGQVPSWLNGTYVRNGPGKFKVDQQYLTHWFDGFAFLASFYINDGQIFYQSTLVKSDQLVDSVIADKLMMNGFADRYKENKPQHISIDGQKVRSSNPNINVEKINGHLVALGEVPLPVEFELSTLKTVGIFDYQDDLKKAKTWECAHIKRDPTSQTLYNFYITYGLLNSYYVIYKIEEGSSERKVIARHRIKYPSYMHDFSITDKYIVLTAYPLVVRAIDLLNPKNSFIGSHKWRPELDSVIYVFDKSNGELLSSIHTDPMFAYHHINAYDTEENNIELLLSAAPSADLTTEIRHYPSIPNIAQLGIQLRKLSIDLAQKSVSQTVLSSDVYELPRVREDLVGKKSRYFYSMLFTPGINKKGFGLAKYDLTKNKPVVWFKDNCFPGEPIFLANPQGLQKMMVFYYPSYTTLIIQKAF